MPLTTYAELQDAIGNFMARDEYKNGGAEEAATQDWIALVEADLNKNKRFLPTFMESRITNSTAASDRYLGLPVDFKRARRVTITSTDPRRVLSYEEPDVFERLWVAADTGIPTTYTIIGDEIAFGKTPDTAYTVEIVYWSKIFATGPTSKTSDQKPLSSSNTSNALLNYHPDIYLFGALAVARPYVGAQLKARLSEYPQLYERAVDACIRSEMARSAPSGGVRMRPAGPTP